MIIDARHILFSPEAIRDAVKTYRELFPQKQPPGLLGPVFIRSTSPLQLGVHVQAMGALGYRELCMEASEVAAMLIIYCRVKKIPLPRNAEKSLEAQGENIGLMMTKAVDLPG
jgi:hypothetical protein